VGIEIVRLYVKKISFITEYNDQIIQVFLPNDEIPENVLNIIGNKCGVKYQNQLITKRATGSTLAIGIIKDDVASLAWLTKTDNPAISHITQYWIIHGCLTFPEYRGKKLYPSMINILADKAAYNEQKDTSVYIESSWSNKASINGIFKCGFSKAGFSISFRNSLLLNKYKLNG
jgi:hypothetical protein